MSLNLDSRQITVESTLGEESATLKIYEDTDGDGNAENTAEYTITGGTERLPATGLQLRQKNQIWFELEITENGDITNQNQIQNIQITY